MTTPVRVLTPAGAIDLRFDGDIYLTGPAEIVAEGEFFLDNRQQPRGRRAGAGWQPADRLRIRAPASRARQ